MEKTIERRGKGVRFLGDGREKTGKARAARVGGRETDPSGGSRGSPVTDFALRATAPPSDGVRTSATKLRK